MHAREQPLLHAGCHCSCYLLVVAHTGIQSTRTHAIGFSALVCSLLGLIMCAGPVGLAPSMAQRSLLVLLERMAPYLAQHLSAAASAPQLSEGAGSHYAVPDEAPAQQRGASDPALSSSADPGAPLPTLQGMSGSWAMATCRAGAEEACTRPWSTRRSACTAEPLARDPMGCACNRGQHRLSRVDRRAQDGAHVCL